MNAPQNREQFLRSLKTMDELNLQAEQMRAEADRPEPLWVSVALVLGVVFVIVLLVLI